MRANQNKGAKQDKLINISYKGIGVVFSDGRTRVEERPQLAGRINVALVNECDQHWAQ
jgi:hypothetical protein